MAQSTYQLDMLLKMRREIRRRCELALASAEEDLLCAKEVESRAVRHSQDHQQLIDTEKQRMALEEQRSAGSFQSQEKYLHRLTRKLEALEAEVQRAREHLTAMETGRDAARQKLHRAAVDLKVVERDRQAWGEMQRKKEQRRAELELEDLSTARFIMNEKGRA